MGVGDGGRGIEGVEFKVEGLWLTFFQIPPRTRRFGPGAFGSGRPKMCVTYPTPYTLHPTPYTLHPTPYTLHPQPCAFFTMHHDTHRTNTHTQQLGVGGRGLGLRSFRSNPDCFQNFLDVTGVSSTSYANNVCGVYSLIRNPTVALCSGTYGDARGAGVSYGRGTPVPASRSIPKPGAFGSGTGHWRRFQSDI